MPSTLDSMSWVAKPLPAKSTSIQPSRTSRATAGPPPVWMTAGPQTARTVARRGRWAARMRSATCATSSALGFSEDTSEFMNSKARRSRSRSGAWTRTPSWPTTIAVAGAHAVHRHGAHDGRPSPSPSSDDEAAVHLRVLDGHPVAVDAHVGGEVGGGVEAGREHAVAVGGDQLGVAVAHPAGAVHREALAQGVDGRLVVVGDSSMHHPAGVEVGATDLDGVDPVVDAGLDDEVEDLREDQ